jgi:hypothetical protein
MALGRPWLETEVSSTRPSRPHGSISIVINARHEYQRATHSTKLRIVGTKSPDVIESCPPQIQLAFHVLYNAETLPKNLKNGSSFRRTNHAIWKIMSASNFL